MTLVETDPAEAKGATATVADATIADAAAAGADVKRRYVQQMFSDIAPTYDRVNRIISFRTDLRWRRKALAALDVARNPQGTYLDLCAGTMDVSAAIARVPGFHGFVTAADFAEPMLRAGLPKVAATSSTPAPGALVRVAPVTADALALPVRDASVDGAIVVFGIRNVADLDAGLREVYRVLRPGGRFVILEFGTPRPWLVRTVYGFYFNHVLPRIGNAVAGHGTAYTYLPKSVAHFPDATALGVRMRTAGFVNVRWTTYTFGVCALHVGEKRSA
jgi:demethylmenaquinone methyltransferase/2-methoxy-6-polyprenyl-1,4-benzoquinol methylase